MHIQKESGGFGRVQIALVHHYNFNNIFITFSDHISYIKYGCKSKGINLIQSLNTAHRSGFKFTCHNT